MFDFLLPYTITRMFHLHVNIIDTRWQLNNYNPSIFPSTSISTTPEAETSAARSTARQGSIPTIKARPMYTHERRTRFLRCSLASSMSDFSLMLTSSSSLSSFLKLLAFFLKPLAALKPLTFLKRLTSLLKLLAGGEADGEGEEEEEDEDEEGGEGEEEQVGGVGGGEDARPDKVSETPSISTHQLRLTQKRITSRQNSPSSSPSCLIFISSSERFCCSCSCLGLGLGLFFDEGVEVAGFSSTTSHQHIQLSKDQKVTIMALRIGNKIEHEIPHRIHIVLRKQRSMKLGIGSNRDSDIPRISIPSQLEALSGWTELNPVLSRIEVNLALD